MEVHPFDLRTSFGNLESNLMFLDITKVLNKEQKILEIGSGVGTLLKNLLDHGYNVQGTETDSEYIKKSKELYGNVPIILVNSELLPFGDNTFDVVISFDVFEHIPNSDNHLAEVKRVLKDGGYYLLQTPNKYTNIPFEIIRQRSLLAWKEDHVALHSYRGIIKRFTRNRFKIEILPIPVVTTFFKLKIDRYLGKFGLFLLKLINIDRLPLYLRTNFYIVAQKLTS
jgi:2-polyprenyl-3-methyl-5-hydroxy-6-metoxy-1,4-benzoquinol methylase